MKQIAILGAGGRMGSWFCEFFFNKQKSMKLLVYDTNQKSLKHLENKAKICKNIEGCILDADIVLVCVPIQKTPPLIALCASKMKRGSILIDISSIKHKSFKILKKIPKYIFPLCIHPMFGPGAKQIEKQKILLIPVRNKIKELTTLKKIFFGATICIINNVAIHDELIAIVLGLTHLMNLIFASYVSSRRDLFSSLKQVSGTTFRLQLLLTEAIITDETDLIAGLLTDNPSMCKHAKKYVGQVNRYTSPILCKNKLKLIRDINKIKRTLKQLDNIDLSYRIMYNLSDCVKTY
jgi:prephenate dehydrogenase